MALKDTWTPKVDDVDDVMASDINEVAAAVIKIEEEGVSGGGTGGGMTEEQVREILAGQIDVGYLTIKGSWSGIVGYDENGNPITMEQTLATKANKDDVVKAETETQTVTYGHKYNDSDKELSIAAMVGKDGTIAGTTAFMRSDYIPINKSSKISYHCYAHASILNLAFYDVGKNFISGIGGDTEWVRIDGTADIPDNAVYVIFCSMNAGSNDWYKISQAVTVSDFIESKTYDYSIIKNDYTTNAYVGTNGSLTSTNSWIASDMIRINSACSFDCELYGTVSTLLYAFYDKDGLFISGKTNSSSGFVKMFDVKPPKNAYFMRYAILDGNSNQYMTIRYKKAEYADIEVERCLKENPLYGKILTATGDSITATVSNRPYASYAKMIAEKNAMKYECRAIWGATLAEGITGSSGCILSTLTNMREDADYIILSGGANDFYYLSSGAEQLGTISTGYIATLDTSTFCGAVESLCKTAIDRWKGKKIVYVITHRMLDISNEDLQTWVSTLIEILEKWGISYIDLWHDMPSLALSNLKNLYTTNGNTVYEGTGDGLHPNEDGYRLYYVPRVENKMRCI